MKKYKWLALLSVLFGATAILGACEKEEPEVIPPPAAAPTVEATFSNFITLEEKNTQNFTGDNKWLSDTYGECVDQAGGLFVFRKVDRTPLDEISETWTVYNTEKGTATWTKTFTYANGDYTGYDEYENAKKKPMEIGVTVDTCNSIGYVRVKHVTNVKYSDAEMLAQMQNNQLWGAQVSSYKTTTSYDYYAATGEYICSSTKALAVYSDYDYSEGVIRFGKTSVKYDKTGKFVEKWNGDTEQKVLYSYETERYGYVTAYYNGETAIEVYHKEKGTLVYRYTMGMEDLYTQNKVVMPLQDGDLMVQYVKSTLDSTYDVMLGGEKYDLITERIDVETGAVTAVKFPYLLSSTMMKEQMDEYLGDELSFTENVYNVAYANKIDGGTVGQETIVFFDNLLNVQYLWSALIPEQTDLEDIQVVSSNELLVQLDTPVEMDGQRITQAVVTKTGTLVGYIPEDAKVLDKYMVINGTIYTFSGEKIYEIDYRGNLVSVNRTIYFGNNILFFGEKEEYNEYGYVYVDHMYAFYEWSWKQYSNMEGDYQYVEHTQDYLLIQDSDGEYQVFDKDMNIVFNSYVKPTVYVDEYAWVFTADVDNDGEKEVYERPLVNRGGAQQ